MINLIVLGNLNLMKSITLCRTLAVDTWSLNQTQSILLLFFFVASLHFHLKLF